MRTSANAERSTPSPERGERYVRSFEPAARFPRLFRVGNAVVRPVLRSWLGRGMHDLALLSFAGRRTGKPLAIPVSWRESNGRGVVLTASGWKANFRGGRDVDVLHEGTTTPMRGELVDDPEAVAGIYLEILRRVGVRRSTLTGLRIAGSRMPTREEIVAAVAGRRAAVRFVPR